MHPLLLHFLFYSWLRILGSDKSAIKFSEDLGLIPRKYFNTPRCPKCGGNMSCKANKGKLGWIWACTNRRRKNTEDDICGKYVNPTENTFFFNSKLPVQDVLAIIFNFVMKFRVTTALDQLQEWRKDRGDKVISASSIVDYYSFCREICEVVASHYSGLLGGPGKTIDIDETFLTKRKYNRGRLTEQMTIVVLGIYCREDKEGLFFQVAGKKKRDLWPYICNYCYPDTAIVCTDSAKQYKNVGALYSNAIHKTTNHSKGEFVSKKDKTNTINALENENKHFKSSIRSRCSMKLLQQYMAVHFYWRHVMSSLSSNGEKIQRFLDDVKAVYPGNGKTGLALKLFDPPTPASQGIDHLMPRERAAEDLDDDAFSDDDVPFVDDSDDSDWDGF